MRKIGMMLVVGGVAAALGAGCGDADVPEVQVEETAVADTITPDKAAAVVGGVSDIQATHVYKVTVQQFGKSDAQQP